MGPARWSDPHAARLALNGDATHYARERSMTNSSRGRLAGVALGALAMACSSHAAPISDDAALHLAAAPEDFKALGVGKEIEV